MDDSSWTTIESDPGVFTELIETIGVKGVQVEELWEPSAEALAFHAPVYGVIFLFKWGGESKGAVVAESAKPKNIDDCPGLYFANQIVNNACATQAILSILLNCSDRVDIGETLKTFKDQTLDLPPKVRGIAIGNNDIIRKAHNSFRIPDGITVTEKAAVSTEDTYHFVAYIPHGGRLYELDGLQTGPIDWGEATQENWLEKVAPVIQERILRYSESETGFNMLALVGNKKEMYSKKLKLAEHQKAAIEAKLTGSELMATDDFDPSSFDLSGSNEELTQRLQLIEAEISELHLQIAEEEDKFEGWNTENIRRRHNYIPFLFNLLKTLAKNDKLDGLIQKAKAKAEERAAKKKEATKK